MAHSEQKAYVERLAKKFPNFFYDKNVIEIGSLDINGSIRYLFRNCRYCGVDVGAGPGVDVVSSGHEIDVGLGRWDVVCSTEMFEHNPHWRETWQRMIELCRPGGLVFFTCASTGRPEHGTSRTTPRDSPLTVGKGWDYYENRDSKDFAVDAFSKYEFEIEPAHHDLYFWGLKRGNLLGE